MRSVDDRTGIARIRDAAIEQFGQHGFNVGLRTIAEEAGVSPALVIHHFGSKEGLRKACDDWITEEIRVADTEALKSMDPAVWFAELGQIESYAPMTAYLLRSMQSGGELATGLWRRLIDNSKEYLEEAVQAGTIRPSRFPEGRAKLLALMGGGSLLLYLQMHDDPSDLAAVLRDYADEIMLPTLELYTEGLMTDSTMFDAFLAQQDKGIPLTSNEGGHDDGDVPAAG
jgi:TetR/AcrR family transcriptional regulator, regulator of cefoperazone and chloramphenicol sensitivity